MGNWNRSDVIALSSLIVAIVATIVSVANPEVRCFFGLQSESCPSSQTTPITPSEPNQNDKQPKPSPPTTTVEPGTNLISKSTGVDYTPLRDLLAAGNWKEADGETYNVMLKVAQRESEGTLNPESIKSFSCDDLTLIDQLWVKYSKGRFGFSVQKRIMQSLGGPSRDYKIWKAFGDRVGWRVEREGRLGWLSYRELTFNLSAPVGHLPGNWWASGWRGLSFRGSEATEDLGLSSYDIWFNFLVFSRAKTCNL